MNAPLSINPTPQTQSWFAKKSRFIAEGTPSANPTIATIIIAFCLFSPKSIKVLVESSTIDINDVTAAKKSAIKKIDAKKTLIT